MLQANAGIMSWLQRVPHNSALLALQRLNPHLNPLPEGEEASSLGIIASNQPPLPLGEGRGEGCMVLTTPSPEQRIKDIFILAKVSRNSPCGSGSGRKFKQCCLH